MEDDAVGDSGELSAAVDEDDDRDDQKRASVKSPPTEGATCDNDGRGSAGGGGGTTKDSGSTIATPESEIYPTFPPKDEGGGGMTQARYGSRDEADADDDEKPLAPRPVPLSVVILTADFSPLCSDIDDRVKGRSSPATGNADDSARSSAMTRTPLTNEPV